MDKDTTVSKIEIVVNRGSRDEIMEQLKTKRLKGE